MHKLSLGIKVAAAAPAAPTPALEAASSSLAPTTVATKAEDNLVKVPRGSARGSARLGSALGVDCNLGRRVALLTVTAVPHRQESTCDKWSQLVGYVWLRFHRQARKLFAKYKASSMKTIVENPHHGESAHGDSVQLLSYFAEAVQSHKCLSCVCITSVACSHVCCRRGEPDTTHSWRARRRKTILSRGTLRVVTMHSKRFNRE